MTYENKKISNQRSMHRIFKVFVLHFGEIKNHCLKIGTHKMLRGFGFIQIPKFVSNFSINYCTDVHKSKTELVVVQWSTLC